MPYRRLLVSRALLIPLGRAVIAAGVLRRPARDFFDVVLRSRIDTSGASSSAHFDVYGFVPDVLSLHPLFGLGLNNFSVYYEFVTGRTNWGPHSFYVALLVETGLVGAALFGVFLLWIFRRLRVARRLGRALAAAGDPLAARVRPLAWGLTAALVATMASNAFYLTMQFYYFYAFAVLALAVPIVFAGGGVESRRAVKVVVLTTSYPRSGRTWRAGSWRTRSSACEAAGVEVEVVSPARFRHFGVAYGGGIVNNLRAEPWRAALVPLFLAAYGRAARSASRDADLVHAHWLPSGWLRSRREAVRAPALGHRRRAGPADAVAGAAGGRAGAARDLRVFGARGVRELGAREVRVIPSGVDVPAEAGGEEAEPPHVLYVGRLSPEKGILDLIDAADGMR